MHTSPRCPLRSRWVLGLMMSTVAAVALSDQSSVGGVLQKATVFSAGGGRLTGTNHVSETVLAESLINTRIQGGNFIMHPGFIPKKKLFLPPSGGIDDSPSPSVAGATHLAAVRPNPFNPSTTVRFTLAAAGAVVLRIYDIRGRLIRTLVERPLESGEHDLTWNGRTDAGQEVASGVYLLEMVAGGYRSHQKMVLAR